MEKKTSKSKAQPCRISYPPIGTASHTVADNLSEPKMLKREVIGGSLNNGLGYADCVRKIKENDSRQSSMFTLDMENEPFEKQLFYSLEDEYQDKLTVLRDNARFERVYDQGDDGEDIGMIEYSDKNLKVDDLQFYKDMHELIQRVDCGTPKNYYGYLKQELSKAVKFLESIHPDQTSAGATAGEGDGYLTVVGQDQEGMYNLALALVEREKLNNAAQNRPEDEGGGYIDVRPQN
jgi:hypothetical protein